MAKRNVPQEIKVELPQVEAESSSRTIEQIQNEYATLAAKAGQAQYQVYTLNKDIEALNSQMRTLNFEAAALKGKESSNG